LIRGALDGERSAPRRGFVDRKRAARRVIGFL